jgi:hypothetical protein
MHLPRHCGNRVAGNAVVENHFTADAAHRTYQKRASAISVSVMPMGVMMPMKVIATPRIGQIIASPGGSGSAIGLAERVAGRGTVGAVVALTLGESGRGSAQ